MNYGIYRINTDEYLKEWDRENGVPPAWVAADKNNGVKTYSNFKAADDDCGILAYLGFYVIAEVVGER